MTMSLIRITRFAEAAPVVEVHHHTTGGGANNFKVRIAVEIPLMVLAISAVVLRLYSRMAVKRKCAIDDILIVCGLCCAFSRTIISTMSASDKGGFSIKGPDHPSELPFYQHIFERRICYIFAALFTRLSVLAYYLRIFPPGLVSLRRTCYVLLTLALCQWIEVFTVLTVFCKDIGKLWTPDFHSFSGSRCFSSSTYSYSAAIGDSVLDCLIFAVPIPYVWRLSKIQARQRIGLIVIFALGFVVCVVALLQIPFIKKRAEDMAYFGNTINLLVAVQLSLAIIAASLPDIRALVARSFPNFSPLHHRSLNGTRRRAGNGNAQGIQDMEAEGRQDCTEQDSSEQNKRVVRKPDWLRSELPQSLMDTRITVTRTETDC